MTRRGWIVCLLLSRTILIFFPIIAVVVVVVVVEDDPKRFLDEWVEFPSLPWQIWIMDLLRRQAQGVHIGDEYSLW